ncbi:MAG: hypothetical protein LW835_17435, partial [Burkholderiaceae bacterium]|nr:hypothetical protein [Burkholderiaceae bacterium]
GLTAPASAVGVSSNVRHYGEALAMNAVPIETLNGYTVCEIFIRDANGDFVHAGFGVFDPDGRLVAAFADLHDALDHLEKVAGPKPPTPGFGR